MQRRTYELAQFINQAHNAEWEPPIAEQRKEAAKLAEVDRGRAAPKKEAPDRGDR